MTVGASITSLFQEYSVPDDLIILDGSTFFVSKPNGDVRPDGASGFFHDDTRHLSTWELLVAGEPVRALTSSTVGARWARVFGTLGESRFGESPRLSVRRDRAIGLALHEDLVVENLSNQKLALTLELLFASDFADIFEIKGHRRRRRRHVDIQVGTDQVTLVYERDGFRRVTAVWLQSPDLVEANRARFTVRLDPGERWTTCIEVSCHADDQEERPNSPCPSQATMTAANLPLTDAEWLEEAPMLATSHDILQHTYRQSLTDLAALRFRPLEQLHWSLPAAGLPWFMALFGRDSLIAAYQALPFQPRLALSTLEALAALQATDSDDFRDAEPGKILHELRKGELATTGAVPHSPYYGTHDATPLFLVLLDEYVQWSGDVEFARHMEGPARAALTWIEEYGDLDGDGYLEYRTRSPGGLRNQSWKDSGDSMRFADGSLAEGPIAGCEVQGYAYDARVRTARLARGAWGDEQRAAGLEEDARLLRQRFNDDFWVAERGHYALALDGDKRPVDSMTSNVGHLLWSGIVDEARAGITVDRLMSLDMFSGWGIRTMSEVDAGYNPMAYHNGSVWPHDTSLVAEGMRRYGYTDAAATLALSVLEAAESFGYRLPELLAGFARRETLVPVEYPRASRPQAWATGAPLLGLRTLLGLDAVEGRLVSKPWIPDEFGWIRLSGVWGPEGRADVP
jgi:glycogen debranching enzyme